jgi:MbtH protein
MSEEYTDWQDWEVKLVRNQEGICSIWPAGRENAPGWEDLGIVGTKAECLEYIKEHCDANCRLLDTKSQDATPQTQ